MKVIDAHTGKEMQVGDTFTDGPLGESMKLLDLQPGIFSAKGLFWRRYQNPVTGQWVESTEWVQLQVRWMHPSFLFQHVAFIPS